MSAAHIPDLAERRRALDPAHSFIVQAPAGSGKTELLIQRYLRLLAIVDHPEEIVAVTFTRKAAGEMRERVLAALVAAQAGAAPATEHEKLTLTLANAVLQRDTTAGWRITDNPARLRIQTIDSMCAALTRQMPILSRFGSQPESVENAAELYLEAARATVELVEGDDAVAQDVERLLAHLDNDVERIETLLAAMLARRDHWLRRINVPGREELEATLGNVRIEALARVRGLFPASLHNELVELARYAADNLAADGRHSSIVACAGLAALPGMDDPGVAAWQGIAELLLTKEGGWRKQHIVSEGFPPGKTKAEKEASKQWKGRALAVIAELCENAVLRNALHDLRFVPPSAYSESQWEVLGAIMRLLPRAVGQLKLVFQSRGQVDFTEIAQGALLALGDVDAPTDLALALDYRIRHLLIDEFQDTSISQYELVARLTAGWEPGDGRTVFAVGDPMQSIYRFREAEVGLFLRARASGIGNVDLQPIGLSANFRSQGGIVDWVNKTFVRVMPKHEDIATGAVPYTASVATRAALGGASVSVHPVFNDDRAAEAAKVAGIVAQARREDPRGTVAILVRNRGHLREIVPQLKEAGLRFRAIEIEELGRRPVVQDLLALTRVLTHLADRLAWLAVLRAPWCGLMLADLHALAGNDQVHTVWEAMNDDARVSQLSPDGRSRLERVCVVLRAAIAHRCRGSLRERIAGVWYALGGPACVEETTELEDAEIYFDYLEQHETAGEIADPVAFEEGLAKLYALPDLEADETLQIMTIHKAKGLEFDTVIVPGLGRSQRNDDKKLFLWMEQPRRGTPDSTDLLMAPIHETGADGDPIYVWLEKLNAEKESFENERLLYVASTRTKQRLHLLGGALLSADRDGVIGLRPPAEKTLLGKLWPVVEPIYAAAANRALESPSPLKVEGAAMIGQTLRRLPLAWALPGVPPHAQWQSPPDRARTQDDIEFSWVGETARHVGSIVHRWLQRIADEELKGWDAARVEAQRKSYRQELVGRGVADADLEAATGRVAAALAHAVQDERGRWLLGPKLDPCNERRITAIIGNERMNLVIDRTFRGADDTCWIIDYKTSSHEGTDTEAFLDRERERYQAQLARYAAAVGDEGAMLGLYFPLLRGWREWQA
jgi:ATP-dependent exoDNAse (exonuclease V) beta subunit